MKVKIQTIHLNIENTLQNLLLEKADKLQKIYNKIESCEIILKENKNSMNKNKTVEINLDIPGSRLFAKDNAVTFEIAAGLAFDEIKSQLKSRKELILQF